MEYKFEIIGISQAVNHTCPFLEVTINLYCGPDTVYYRVLEIYNPDTKKILKLDSLSPSEQATIAVKASLACQEMYSEVMEAHDLAKQQNDLDCFRGK